jgi:hypothetical protein
VAYRRILLAALATSAFACGVLSSTGDDDGVATGPDASTTDTGANDDRRGVEDADAPDSAPAPVDAGDASDSAAYHRLPFFCGEAGACTGADICCSKGPASKDCLTNAVCGSGSGSRLACANDQQCAVNELCCLARVVGGDGISTCRAGACNAQETEMCDPKAPICSTGLSCLPVAPPSTSLSGYSTCQ